MILKTLFGIALALSLTYIFKMVLFLDYHKTVWNHRPGKCHIVEGIDHGSEDMQTTKSGLTFITSGIDGPFFTSAMKEYHKKNNARGRIMLFNLEKPADGVRELMIVGNQFSYEDFAPHGISVLEEKDKIFLFVVVHRAEEDTVEKFEFLEKTLELKHLKTYKGTLVHLLNDVAATGHETFYTTEFGYYRNYIGHILEQFIGLSYGHLLYYDGRDFIPVSEPTYMVNGITLSKDGRHVYTVSSPGKKFIVYKREANNRLTKMNEVELYTIPDNPTIDPVTGDVLLGCHPIGIKIAKHLNDPGNESTPSQVLMLHMDKSGTNVTGITELLSDNLELYGSTTATLYKKRMLVGTVCHKMMYCEVNML
ncbi:serum paraoxonase/arylesterase 1-like isoform X2 [Crassostrea angulata]|uniref:serum paraoxonase/arylesterase 1-like isoform X2 n=1 Tax=Magallana angulata TaxID=2784310 RepID=UPI0022B20696|nr:serum paraoxonase/arylesterase 1-like isoform X2 [Crassostrea angulata]